MLSKTPISNHSVDYKFDRLGVSLANFVKFGPAPVNLFIVGGRGGVGKTHTIKEVLTEQGMIRIDPDEQMSIYDWSRELKSLSGKTMPPPEHMQDEEQPVEKDDSITLMDAIIIGIFTLGGGALIGMWSAFWGIGFVAVMLASFLFKKKSQVKAVVNNVVNTIDPAQEVWKHYNMISGKETPKAIFETMELFPNILHWFDDCDSVLEHTESVEMMKGFCDSTHERSVQHGRAGEKRNINFRGRVCISTNKSREWLEKHCQPLMSRAIYIDCSMDDAEIIERMEQIAHTDKFLNNNDFIIEDVEKALEYMIARQKYLTELSLRTLVKVSQEVKTFGFDEKHLDLMFCRKD